MTLDAQTLGVVDTDVLMSERPAEPKTGLKPNLGSAAPPTLSEPANLQLEPLVGTPDRGDGPPRHDSHIATAVADLSARHCGPDDHSTYASDGSAQIRHDALGSYGAPTPFDPALCDANPERGLPGRGDGLPNSAAVANLSEPAGRSPSPNKEVRARRGGHKTSGAQLLSVPAKPTSRAKAVAKTNDAVPGSGDDLSRPETLTRSVVANPSEAPIDEPTPNVAPALRGDGQPSPESQGSTAVATIVDLWRQRVDLRRAEGRLNLQARATIRRALGGDKEAAQKAWGAIQRAKEADPALAMVVEPYRQAMAVLDGSAKALEKQLCKMVRPLPLWTWAADVRGLGELSIAGLIGEAAGLPGQYKSVSAVWKRFGLAVIEGGRQRRVADAQAALIHGYAPQRRAFAYVLSTQLMRSQRADDPYRAIYDRRKAYELEREIPKAHAHNRALRYMVKELLKRAYLADRRGEAE